MSKIWAIILAAGESQRMGVPKMLLDFGGKTMLERVIDNVTGSEIINIMIVLGAEKEKISDIVKIYPVRSCYNDKYKEGMLSSVKCGIRNLPPDYEAVLIFQGDQPLISPGVSNIIIKVYRSTGKGIVIPLSGGKRGHPLLIDRKYGNEIELTHSSQGLRSLSYRFPDDVMEVETYDPGILKDIDNYADYKEINKYTRYEREN